MKQPNSLFIYRKGIITIGTEEIRRNGVPIWEKFNLTVVEAAEYFNIGEKKIRKLIDDYLDASNTFVIQNGRNVLINRKKLKNSWIIHHPFK